MPRLKNQVPKLCHHKGQNLAMVYINGKVRYLGRWDSPEAKEAYKRFVAEWATGATQSTPVAPADLVPITAPHVLTIAEALIQSGAYAERYYQSRETDNLREALKPLREKFGFLPLRDFGPIQLRTGGTSGSSKGLPETQSTPGSSGSSVSSNGRVPMNSSRRRFSIGSTRSSRSCCWAARRPSRRSR